MRGVPPLLIALGLCLAVSLPLDSLEGFILNEILALRAAGVQSVNTVPIVSTSTVVAPSASAMPIVTAHGMGDSCFNSGMQSITKAAGGRVGAYSVCIPTGDTRSADTSDGFFENMDKSVDVFAAKIKNDTNLAGGFDAIGFSQGNSLIRGYIQKYNDPPVRYFLSVHGTVVGVAGFPNCNPAGILGPVCDVLAKVLGDLAYSSMVQDHLFQADYFRDPMRVTESAYLEGSQLAQWNNEGKVTPSYKENFGKTQKFIMVKALKDSMVYPNEGEHWGCFADGQFKNVLTMKDTRWYKEDLFGLKTADEAGKIFFETTPGNHLQFTEQDLFGWIDKYIKA